MFRLFGDFDVLGLIGPARAPSRPRASSGRRTHLRAAERRQSRRSRGSTRLAHPCTATAPPYATEGNCSRPRRSRAYAKFGDVAAWSGRFCRSSSKAPAKRARHRQTKVMALRRVRGSARRRMDGKGEFSRVSKIISRTAHRG